VYLLNTGRYFAETRRGDFDVCRWEELEAKARALSPAAFNSFIDREPIQYLKGQSVNYVFSFDFYHRKATLKAYWYPCGGRHSGQKRAKPIVKVLLAAKQEFCHTLFLPYLTHNAL
jgi:hypothetical protein